MQHELLLESFDALVQAGIIKYGPPAATRVVDEGYTFHFFVSQGQQSKEAAEPSPALENSDEGNAQAIDQPRNFGPGSDLSYDERLVIGNLDGHHVMCFNLYPIVRPQLLLLTLDSYRDQHDALDAHDFASTNEVLNQLCKSSQPYYAFFNCGWIGGASRHHKHIQVLPQEHELFPDAEAYQATTIPFQHFLFRFNKPSEQITSTELDQCYRDLLDQARAALQLAADEVYCPHNVIMTLNWILVIPRRKAFASGISTPNAPGMMGSVWLSSPERLAAWLQLGPASVLASYGVPHSSRTG